ncbi:MAG: DOMON-like domain-containing protein [Sphingomicrobium sp.]
MRLIVHPESQAGGVESLGGTVSRFGTTIRFHYMLAGDVGRIVSPPPARPRRADGLWQTTCFEAFIRSDGEAYVELNFSPSSEWAAYQFDSPREGMRPLDLAAEPDLSVHHSSDLLILSALVRLPAKFSRSGAPLGLAAVIEEQSGTKSYWALGHPPGAPDFHHPDCFVVQLP